MLPYSGHWAITAQATELVALFCEALSRACNVLLRELTESEFALLGPRSAHSDFYFLPLRIMNVLGWVAAGLHTSRWIGRPELFDQIVARQLSKLIVEKYSGSIVAVSDEQTSPFISFLTAISLLDLSDDCEQVTCLLFSAFCDLKGNITRDGIAGDDAYKYLSAKMSSDYSDVDDLLVT